MDQRPKIKPALSKTDRFVEILCIILLFILWAAAIGIYIFSPDIIPVHFDLAGNINRYGNKITIFSLPIIATIIFAGITWLGKYPHIFNYMVPITPENALLQYTHATRLLRYLKLIVVFIFTWLVFFSYPPIAGSTKGLGIWFFPVMITLLLLPTIFFLKKSLKKK